MTVFSQTFFKKANKVHFLLKQNKNQEGSDLVIASKPQNQVQDTEKPHKFQEKYTA